MQLLVDEYKEPYRKDRNAHGRRLSVYVKQDIPSRELNDHPPLPNSFDVIVIELNFKKSYAASNQCVQANFCQRFCFLRKDIKSN